MTPAAIRDATAKISKARAALILSHPFWAAIALRLDVKPHPAVETIGTDGRGLYFNPDWINGQKPDHLVTIVAHEAGHCSLLHPFRRQNRDPRLFNVACDHVLNNLLKASGFTMPPHGLCDKRFAGMSSEEAYSILLREQPPPPPPKGGTGKGMPDYGGMGCVVDAVGEDGKPLPQAEREAVERDWKVATMQAAQAAKAQGNLPGCLEGLIEAIRAPKLDWRAMLREFIRSAAKNDYSWRRPNPRFLASGDYLPSLYDETMGPIAMGVDTSGSVSQAELEAVCSELNAALDTARPESVHVVYCDAEVHGHETFTPEDWPVKMRVQGRGGTDLSGLWPYIEEQEIRPCVAIVCTDMELRARDLGDDPGFPVLILTTGRQQPIDGPVSFGTVVKLDVEP